MASAPRKQLQFSSRRDASDYDSGRYSGGKPAANLSVRPANQLRLQSGSGDAPVYKNRVWPVSTFTAGAAGGARRGPATMMTLAGEGPEVPTARERHVGAPAESAVPERAEYVPVAGVPSKRDMAEVAARYPRDAFYGRMPSAYTAKQRLAVPPPDPDTAGAEPWVGTGTMSERRGALRTVHQVGQRQQQLAVATSRARQEVAMGLRAPRYRGGEDGGALMVMRREHEALVSMHGQMMAQNQHLTAALKAQAEETEQLRYAVRKILDRRARPTGRSLADAARSLGLDIRVMQRESAHAQELYGGYGDAGGPSGSDRAAPRAGAGGGEGEGSSSGSGTVSDVVLARPHRTRVVGGGEGSMPPPFVRRTLKDAQRQKKLGTYRAAVGLLIEQHHRDMRAGGRADYAKLGRILQAMARAQAQHELGGGWGEDDEAMLRAARREGNPPRRGSRRRGGEAGGEREEPPQASAAAPRRRGRPPWNSRAHVAGEEGASEGEGEARGGRGSGLRQAATRVRNAQRATRPAPDGGRQNAPAPVPADGAQRALVEAATKLLEREVARQAAQGDAAAGAGAGWEHVYARVDRMESRFEQFLAAAESHVGGLAGRGGSGRGARQPARAAKAPEPPLAGGSAGHGAGQSPPPPVPEECRSLLARVEQRERELLAKYTPPRAAEEDGGFDAIAGLLLGPPVEEPPAAPARPSNPGGDEGAAPAGGAGVDEEDQTGASGVGADLVARVLEAREDFLRQQRALDGSLMAPSGEPFDPVALVEETAEALLLDLVDEGAGEVGAMLDGFAEQLFANEFRGAAQPHAEGEGVAVEP